ncbi:MAG: hypothetical protein ABL869_10580 [Candidatus Nitrotoga sp.]
MKLLYSTLLLALFLHGTAYAQTTFLKCTGTASTLFGTPFESIKSKEMMIAIIADMNIMEVNGERYYLEITYEQYKGGRNIVSDSDSNAIVGNRSFSVDRVSGKISSMLFMRSKLIEDFSGTCSKTDPPNRVL